MSFPALTTSQGQVADLEEVVRTLPDILARLRTSYDELEERATRVESELSEANRELAGKVRELDELRAHLEAVLESLPCGVVVRDAEGHVVRSNRLVSELLGCDGDELGTHPALVEDTADGTPREHRLEDGRRLALAHLRRPVRRSDGSVEGSVEIVDDRTERTRLVERLHAADKVAALGTMAAGIAHEIRNPMNAVRGFAELLARQELTDERHARWARLIVEGVAEADGIIENMLSFGSPERLRSEAIDVRELLEEALRLERGDAVRERSGVTLEVPPGTFDFRGDRIKLRQAVRNLIANAIESQHERPRVHVAADREDDLLVIRVSDAGPGVPSDLRARILDPFFTTRPEGTGLGLALVSVIARLHGGELELSSEPSELGGAEFRIRIPFLPPGPSGSRASTGLR